MSSKHSCLLRRRLACTTTTTSPFTRRGTQSTTNTTTTTCYNASSCSVTSSCRLTTSSSTIALSSSNSIVVLARRGYAALGAKGGAMPSPHSAEHFFVQFQETPNEECMKFFVEGQHFLLPLDTATIHRAAPIARKPVDITKKRVLLVKKKSTPVDGNADATTSSTTPTSSSSLHPHLRNLVSEDAFEGGSHHEEQYADEGYSGGVAASKAQMTASMEGTAVDDTDASSSSLPPIPAPAVNLAAARAMPMTMSFDKSNNFLSPLAQSLMEGCPMIEEVTVGHSFITVRRIPEDEMVERLIEAEAQEVKQVDLFKGAHPPGGKPKTAEEASAACCTPPSSSTAPPPSPSPSTEESCAKTATPAEEKKSCATPATLKAAPTTTPEATPEAPVEKATPKVPLSEDTPPTTTSTTTSSPDDTNENTNTEGATTPVKEEDKKEDTTTTTEPPVDGGDVPVSESDEAKYRNAAHGALSWGELQFTVSALLMDHLFTGAPHITPGAPHPHPDTLPAEGDSEVMLVIKELVSDVIRPLVQQDGGDVRLVKFEPISADDIAAKTASEDVKAVSDDVSSSTALIPANVKGRVWVEMLGACKSCKSSKTTLKDLIERTIQHWVPEVHEVVEFDAIAKAKAQEETKLMLQKAFEARRAASEAAAAAVAAKVAAAKASSSSTSVDESDDDQPPQTLHEEEIPEMDLP